MQNVCILPRRRQSELRSVCASLQNLIPLAVVIVLSPTREVKLQTVTAGSASLCCGSHRQWYTGCEWTPSGGDNHAFHGPFEGRVVTTITVRVEFWAVWEFVILGLPSLCYAHRCPFWRRGYQSPCRMSVVSAVMSSSVAVCRWLSRFVLLFSFSFFESVVRSVLAVHVGITCLSLRLP